MEEPTEEPPSKETDVTDKYVEGALVKAMVALGYHKLRTGVGIWRIIFRFNGNEYYLDIHKNDFPNLRGEKAPTYDVSLIPFGEERSKTKFAKFKRSEFLNLGAVADKVKSLLHRRCMKGLKRSEVLLPGYSQIPSPFLVSPNYTPAPSPVNVPEAEPQEVPTYQPLVTVSGFEASHEQSMELDEPEQITAQPLMDCDETEDQSSLALHLNLSSQSFVSPEEKRWERIRPQEEDEFTLPFVRLTIKNVKVLFLIDTSSFVSYFPHNLCEDAGLVQEIDKSVKINNSSVGVLHNVEIRNEHNSRMFETDLFVTRSVALFGVLGYGSVRKRARLDLNAEYVFVLHTDVFAHFVKLRDLPEQLKLTKATFLDSMRWMLAPFRKYTIPIQSYEFEDTHIFKGLGLNDIEADNILYLFDEGDLRGSVPYILQAKGAL